MPEVIFIWDADEDDVPADVLERFDTSIREVVADLPFLPNEGDMVFLHLPPKDGFNADTGDPSGEFEVQDVTYDVRATARRGEGSVQAEGGVVATLRFKRRF